MACLPVTGGPMRDPTPSPNLNTLNTYGTYCPCRTSELHGKALVTIGPPNIPSTEMVITSNILYCT